MCVAQLREPLGSLVVYLVNIRGCFTIRGDLMNRYPMTAYQQKKMLVATVTIPKPMAITVVLCSAASSVILNRLWMTSASTTRITTNCMMLTPLTGKIPTSYPKDDDDLWGTRVRCTPSPMGGGVMYFCEVVCVALSLYLN